MTTTELTALSPAECWRRLRSVPVGRLAYTEHALPAIRPVNFTVQDDQVLIWSRPGSKTDAIRGQVVAFEVDEIDPHHHTGWSVVVLGKVDVVTDIDELVRLANPVRSWAPGPRDCVLKIPVERISGRQITLAQPSNGVVGARVDQVGRRKTQG